MWGYAIIWLVGFASAQNEPTARPELTATIQDEFIFEVDFSESEAEPSKEPEFAEEITEDGEITEIGGVHQVDTLQGTRNIISSQLREVLADQFAEDNAAFEAKMEEEKARLEAGLPGQKQTRFRGRGPFRGPASFRPMSGFRPEPVTQAPKTTTKAATTRPRTTVAAQAKAKWQPTKDTPLLSKDIRTDMLAEFIKLKKLPKYSHQKRCIRCINAPSFQDCIENGEVEHCRNDESCETIMRFEKNNNVMRTKINSMCKQRNACQVAAKQKHGCQNKKLDNRSCWHCCSGDLCNFFDINPLTPFKPV
jgi:hypothetical protein